MPATINVAEALLNARCRLMTRDPWFGTFASYFTWVPDEQVRTLGVILRSRSRIECRYNPKFIGLLSMESIMAAVEHELMHVVLLHLSRFGSRSPLIWNFATDMIINGTFIDPLVENLKNIETEAGEIDEETGEFKPFKLIWYPSHWPSNLTSEEVYERLEQCRIVLKMPGGNTKVVNEGAGDSPEEVVIEGDTLDDHGTWDECEVSEDEARQIVKDLCEATTSQVGVGQMPGKVVGAIDKLNQPVRNWKQELRHIVGRKFGGKRRTYARQNRRRQTFGSPGKSSHASAPLTVAIDTSASVDKMRLEQFVSELESMSQRFKITQVQFDAAYQYHGRYHRGDWQSFEIHGRGGTSFKALFQALDEKELWGRLTLICTDGEAPWPKDRGHAVMWVIFPHGSIETAPKPPFGDTIYIEK